MSTIQQMLEQAANEWPEADSGRRADLIWDAYDVATDAGLDDVAEGIASLDTSALPGDKMPAALRKLARA